MPAKNPLTLHNIFSRRGRVIRWSVMYHITELEHGFERKMRDAHIAAACVRKEWEKKMRIKKA